MGSARKPKHHLQLRSRSTRSSKGRLLSSTDPAQNTALLTSQLRSLGLYAAPTLGDGNCLFRALSDQLHGSPSRHYDLRTQICDWIQQHRDRYEPFVEDERGLEVHLRCMRENGTYGGHMELSAFAHLSRRNVKVIQPGLVYVIEWSAFASPSSPTFSHPDDLNPRDVRHIRRDKVRGDDRSPKNTATRYQGNPRYLSGSTSDHGERNEDNDTDKDKEQGDHTDTIYVAYHDWEHFSSIRNLRGPHAGLPHVRETPPPVVLEPSPLKGKKKKVTLKLSAVSAPAQAKDGETKIKLKLKPSGSSSLSSLTSISSTSSTSFSLSPPGMDMDTTADPMPDPDPDPDPTTIPLPTSRSASPFPPSTASTSSLSPPSSSVPPPQPPHPLRTSYLPLSTSEPQLPLKHFDPLLPNTSITHAGPKPAYTPKAKPIQPGLNPGSPPRSTRSPKRSFDDDDAGSESSFVGNGKRTRRSLAPDAMDVDIDVDVDQDPDPDVDLDVDTPSLSSPSSTSTSTSPASSEAPSSVSSSSASSPEPDVLPQVHAPHPPATPKTPRIHTHHTSTPTPTPTHQTRSATAAQEQERPLTRRQRKMLGLPKARAALATNGKIVIPGGRFGGGAGSKEGEMEMEIGEEEWRRNGAGRVDVRGFRELKI